MFCELRLGIDSPHDEKTQQSAFIGRDYAANNSSSETTYLLTFVFPVYIQMEFSREKHTHTQVRNIAQEMLPYFECNAQIASIPYTHINTLCLSL